MGQDTTLYDPRIRGLKRHLRRAAFGISEQDEEWWCGPAAVAVYIAMNITLPLLMGWPTLFVTMTFGAIISVILGAALGRLAFFALKPLWWWQARRHRTLGHIIHVPGLIGEIWSQVVTKATLDIAELPSEAKEQLAMAKHFDLARSFIPLADAYPAADADRKALLRVHIAEQISTGLAPVLARVTVEQRDAIEAASAAYAAHQDYVDLLVGRSPENRPELPA